MPLSGQVIGKRTRKTGERARLGRGVGDMRGFVLEYVNDVAMSGRKNTQSSSGTVRSNARHNGTAWG